MTAPARRRWIAIATHPHRERQAIEHLARQGYAPYCPLVDRWIAHARRKTLQARAMFPGYCFVPTGAPLAPIRSTRGVREIVRFGTMPAELDDTFIAALRAREIDGVVARPDSPFRPGDDVAVTAGPFEGALARVFAADDAMRVTILFELMQRCVTYEVDGRFLSRVGGAPDQIHRRTRAR